VSNSSPHDAEAVLVPHHFWTALREGGGCTVEGKRHFASLTENGLQASGNTYGEHRGPMRDEEVNSVGLISERMRQLKRLDEGEHPR
jgi:hypothetical protein